MKYETKILKSDNKAKKKKLKTWTVSWPVKKKNKKKKKNIKTKIYK